MNPCKSKGARIGSQPRRRESEPIRDWDWGVLTIHRFDHQSAGHESSGRVGTAKLRVFSTPVFFDRFQKTKMLTILTISRIDIV